MESVSISPSHIIRSSRQQLLHKTDRRPILPAGQGSFELFSLGALIFFSINRCSKPLMPGGGGTEPINQQNGKRTGLHVARVSSDNEGLRCGTFSFCVNQHNTPDLPTGGAVMPTSASTHSHRCAAQRDSELLRLLAEACHMSACWASSDWDCFFVGTAGEHHGAHATREIRSGTAYPHTKTHLSGLRSLLVPLARSSDCVRFLGMQICGGFVGGRVADCL